MIEIVKQNRLEVLQIIFYFIIAVAFLIGERYLLALAFAFILLKILVQLYRKVKKSKEEEIGND